jgi:RHS repeat-associated protein
VRLRLPGQIALGLGAINYNYFRDYDPNTGRYVESDPIGIEGGLNTYAYAFQNPLRFSDPYGLEVRFVCRALGGTLAFTGKQHCFVFVSCPKEGWQTTFSLFSGGGLWPSGGYKRQNDPHDKPWAPSNKFNGVVTPQRCFADECAYEKEVVRRYQSFPSGEVPYAPLGPNSNSFAQDLLTGTQFGVTLPPGVPGPGIAPGIDIPHPNFP